MNRKRNRLQKRFLASNGNQPEDRLLGYLPAKKDYCTLGQFFGLLNLPAEAAIVLQRFVKLAPKAGFEPTF
jgi:hypothetical protein